MKFEDKVMLAMITESLSHENPKEMEVSVKIDECGKVKTRINTSLAGSVVCITELVKAVSRATKAEPEEVIRVIGYGMGIRS